MGAIFTCPLEVVKTRLQSSNSGFGSSPSALSETKEAIKSGVAGSKGSIRNSVYTPEIAVRGPMQITVPVANMHSRASMSISSSVRLSSTTVMPPKPPSMNIVQCLRWIFDRFEFTYFFENQLSRNLTSRHFTNFLTVLISRIFFTESISFVTFQTYFRKWGGGWTF